MKYLKWFLIGIGILLLLAAGAFGFVSHSANQALSQTYEGHDVDFPVPWPLSEEEIEELREELSPEDEDPFDVEELTEEQLEELRKKLADEGVEELEEKTDEEAVELARKHLAPESEPEDPLEDVDLDEIALERALERGEHLLQARYPCAECHGENMAGGVMIDNPAIGTVLGPNLTSGEGGVVDDYTVADWDRIVRHGLLPDNSVTLMPSVDFFAMSDRELSDIIAYIGSLPPVDNEVPPVTLGPLGKFLVATGEVLLSADLVEDHHAEHPVLPPAEEVTEEFGKHLSQVCAGCHGEDFRGGPIPGGPPDWPEATNLTSHDEGLGGWTFVEFDQLMRTGTRQDGSEIGPPMSDVIPFGAQMTDVEMQAIFKFFTSLPPEPTPQ